MIRYHIWKFVTFRDSSPVTFKGLVLKLSPSKTHLFLIYFKILKKLQKNSKFCENWFKYWNFRFVWNWNTILDTFSILKTFSLFPIYQNGKSLNKIVKSPEGISGNGEKFFKIYEKSRKSRESFWWNQEMQDLMCFKCIAIR